MPSENASALGSLFVYPIHGMGQPIHWLLLIHLFNLIIGMDDQHGAASMYRR